MIDSCCKIDSSHSSSMSNRPSNSTHRVSDRFTSIEEAYDALFGIRNGISDDPEFEESDNRAHYDAMKKAPLDKMVKVLRTLVKRITKGTYSLQTWARFKMGCYEGYGWDENRFITDVFMWTMKIVDDSAVPQIDLKWEMLDNQMLCYIVWLALMNGLPGSVMLDGKTNMNALWTD